MAKRMNARLIESASVADGEASITIFTPNYYKCILCAKLGLSDHPTGIILQVAHTKSWRICQSPLTRQIHISYDDTVDAD